MKERKDRVDDAMHATRAAVEEAFCRVAAYRSYGLSRLSTQGGACPPQRVRGRHRDLLNARWGGLQQYLAGLFREIRLSFRREMHIAYLARAENELLASPLEDKLCFVLRKDVRGAVSSEYQFGWGNATISLHDFIMATRINRIFARTVTGVMSGPGPPPFRCGANRPIGRDIDAISAPVWAPFGQGRRR